MSSATSSVFGTTELLEIILLELDMRTLICSQRVNKEFRATFQGSQVLWQATFLEPIKVSSSMQIGPLPLSTSPIKERLALPVREVFSTFGSCERQSITKTGHTLTDVIWPTTLNPMLFCSKFYTDAHGSYVRMSTEIRGKALTFHYYKAAAAGRRPRHYESPPAIYGLSDMLLVQPAQDLSVHIKDGLGDDYICAVTAKFGTNLGQLFEAVGRKMYRAAI